MSNHIVISVSFQYIKIVSKQYIEKTLAYRQSKLLQKKYIEMAPIFHSSGLRREKYIEITSIICSPILHQTKYVEATWIFCLSKSHHKSTSKQSGFFSHQNDIEKICRKDVEICRHFFFQYINVVLTSNQLRLKVLCQLV